jgi:DNA modification methylase
MGFDEGEVNKLMGAMSDGDESEEAAPENAEPGEDDPIPDIPARPVTQAGDVWLLGKHRLICGDSTKPETVRQLMGSDKAALCFSSPPYANQRDYTQGIDDWNTLMRGVYGNLVELMAPSGQILVNLGLIHRNNEWMPYWDGWIEWMRVQGWRRFGWYVWYQGFGLPGDWNGRLAPAFEFIFHFNKDARKPNKIIPCKHAGTFSHLNEKGIGSNIRNRDGTSGAWTHAGQPVQEYRIPDSVICLRRQSGPIGKDIDHPAVFPVGLPEHIMLAYSDENEIVYEPFSGSGSSLLAGERCNRLVRAAEIAPEYVDVAMIRFTRAHPDIPAILHATGQTFEEVRHERQPAH